MSDLGYPPPSVTPPSPNPSRSAFVPSFGPPAPPIPPPAGKKRLSKGAVIAIVALVVVLGCCGSAAFLGLLVDGFTRSPGMSFTPPAAESLVTTQEWGVVPSGYIGVVLGDGADRGLAEDLAKGLGGTVVGELADIGLYQIRTDSTDEAGLRAALEIARASEGVKLAFVDQAAQLDVAGIRCTPLADTVYAEGGSRAFDIIGVQRAWDVIKASGLPLSEVQVGVTDDGLYLPSGEFDGAVKVETSGADDGHIDPKANYGSHGTAVTGLIAANPDNAGVAGIASVLGDKLRVNMTNVYGAEYGTWKPAVESADKTTYYDAGGYCWGIGDLVAINKQVAAGATIVNMSWGQSKAQPELAAAYKEYFEYMAKNKPNVLFVCSAGNEGEALDGSTRYPSGLTLPNMITVGAIDNDGKRASFSNTNGKDYVVDIAAPAKNIPISVDKDGTVVNQSGTSLAAPQVVATAAMLRSLDPSMDAAALKEFILATASPGVTNVEGTQSIPAPESLGGRVLSTEFAVLAAANNLRAAKGLEPLDGSSLGAVTIALTAEKAADGRWALVAGVPGVGPKGTSVELTYNGAGSIGGRTTQRLAKSGTVGWTATVSGDSMTVHVKRADTQACWRVVLEGDGSAAEPEPEPEPVPAPEQAPPARAARGFTPLVVVGATKRGDEFLITPGKEYTVTAYLSPMPAAQTVQLLQGHLAVDGGNTQTSYDQTIPAQATPDPDVPGRAVITCKLTIPEDGRNSWSIRFEDTAGNAATGALLWRE